MKTTLLLLCLGVWLFVTPARAQFPTLPGGTSHETAAPDGAKFMNVPVPMLAIVAVDGRKFDR